MIHLEYVEQGTDLGIAIPVEFHCGCGETHTERIDKIIQYDDDNWLLPCLLMRFEQRIFDLEHEIYGPDTEGDLDGDEDRFQPVAGETSETSEASCEAGDQRRDG